MPSANELQRLAAAANAIRPDWPVRSLLTLLTRDHAARPYRDLAVALAWVACDPQTKTPQRLAEPGPWWRATSMTEAVGPGNTSMRCPEHPDQKAANCAVCDVGKVPMPADLFNPYRPHHAQEASHP